MCVCVPLCVTHDFTVTERKHSSHLASGFGGLVVSVLVSGTRSNPAEAVRFFRAKKNPKHAFLRKGSKAVCPMSQICGMLKNPTVYRGSRKPSAKLSGHFSPISRSSLTEVSDVA